MTAHRKWSRWESVVAALLGLFAVLLTGCPSTQLGQCVPEQAEQLVFDRDGNPAFAGQAMVEQLCVGCHSEASTGEVRRGAPAGLDFEMVGIRDVTEDGGPIPVGEENEEQLATLARLRRAREVIFEHRFGMFDTVENGSMPPGGIGEESIIQLAFMYISGAPLPALESEEGQEIYRDWLACNAPIVERTATSPLPEFEGQRCEESAGVGACVYRIDPNIEPIEPTWSSIQERVFRPGGCLSSTCHVGSDPAAGLALDGSPDSLVGIAPDAAGRCSGESMPLVDAEGTGGDVSNSLFFEKLARGPGAGSCDAYERPTTRCGTSMPVGRFVGCAALSAVRNWIEAGAPDN